MVAELIRFYLINKLGLQVIVLKALAWMLFCIMETFCYGLFSLFMGDRGKFISLQLCLLSACTPTLVIKVLGEYEYNLFASVTKSSCPSHFFLCSFSSPRKTQPISQVLHTRDRLGEQKGGIRWKRRHAGNLVCWVGGVSLLAITMIYLLRVSFHYLGISTENPYSVLFLWNKYKLSRPR